jgi:HAD superfamily hydrolase (TIGR01484 family)
MRSKAIIFDIDGTAIDSPSQKLPSERLVRAAREVMGTYFLCAATGRVWTFARPILQGMRLEDPCIISGGTQICNPKTGKILWQCDVEPADMAKVVEIARRHPDYKVLYNDNDEEAYLHGGFKTADLRINEPVYFFEFIFVPQNIAPGIVAELSKLEGVAVTLVVAQRPGYNDIHVTNRNATKEHAVTELLGRLHVGKEDTIGVGDGHNDIHLFNAVKHKVTMSNGVQELRQLADESIGTVTEDGFAAYLETLSSR